MERTDLPEIAMRAVAWKRRSTAKAAGGMVEKLVDVYEDPDEFIAEFGHLLIKYDAQIEAKREAMRDAA